MTTTFIQHLLENTASKGTDNFQSNKNLLNAILSIFGQPELGQEDANFLDYLEHSYKDNILTAEGIVNTLDEIVSNRQNPGGKYNSEFTNRGEEEEEPSARAYGDKEMVRQNTEDKWEARDQFGDPKRSDKRLSQMANRWDRGMEGIRTKNKYR